MYGHYIQQSMDQPGKVANRGRGQLNSEENELFPVHVRIWSHETGSAVPSRVSLLILHTQAESCRMTTMTGPYCAIMCILSKYLVHIYIKGVLGSHQKLVFRVKNSTLFHVHIGRSTHSI